MKVFFLLFIVLIGFSAFGQNKAKKQPVFHAFLFANTNDPSIGKACREDLTNMTKQVHIIASAIGYNIDEQLFEGYTFDTSSIYNLLKHAQIKDSDIVLLYFTTHGGRNDKDTSEFPNIIFPGRNESLVNSESIHLKFKKKFHPKFLMTMIDACNNLSQMPPSKIVIFKDMYKHNFSPVLHQKQVNFYKKFFRYSSGDIIMSSSQKGATSLCTPDGSIFTNEFIGLSERFSNYFGTLSQQPATSWDGFFNVLQSSTKNKNLLISYQDGDTTSRYPVWKHSPLSTISLGCCDQVNIDDGYPIFNINIFQAGEINNNGLRQFGMQLTQHPGGDLAPKPFLRKATYHIQEAGSNSDTVLVGTKENHFTVYYQTSKQILVYAIAEFYDGRKFDIAILEN